MLLDLFLVVVGFMSLVASGQTKSNSRPCLARGSPPIYLTPNPNPNPKRGGELIHRSHIPTPQKMGSAFQNGPTTPRRRQVFAPLAQSSALDSFDKLMVARGLRLLRLARVLRLSHRFKAPTADSRARASGREEEERGGPGTPCSKYPAFFGDMRSSLFPKKGGVYTGHAVCCYFFSPKNTREEVDIWSRG